MASRFAGFPIALVAVLLSSTGDASAAGPDVGGIEGIVKDMGGAGLPGVTVSVAGPVTRNDRTGSAGAFKIGGLRPGTYTLTSSLQGFKNAAQTVIVKAGEIAQTSLTLTVSRSETMIVTASRIETLLADAPATVSVIEQRQLEVSPARNYADALRDVPGINAVQSSARDVNIASRQASPFLTGTELALVDGRPIFFDFFNLVLWDFVSVGGPDVDQIEVVRGPASVMWGANAATGVVNIISRSPRETPGVWFDLSGGAFPRAGESAGGTFSASARYAGMLGESLSYRLSAGFYESGAFSRPTGTIPVSGSAVDPSIQVGGGKYENVAYSNRGTRQPRVDLRVDQEVGDGARISYSAGYAGTEGIIQTQIGPFDIQRGANLSYGRIVYTSGGFHLSGFGNFLRGNAPSLVTVDGQGQPLRIEFRNSQYDLDGGWSRLLGERHLVNLGANVRYNAFDLSIAPDAKSRTDVGLYVQDEVDLSPFKLAAGLRADKPQNLPNVTLSPRVALMWSPGSGHQVRASYNKAFRTPSAIDNAMNISVVGGSFPLGAIDPRLGNATFPIVTQTIGNPTLKPESLTSWELGYQGSSGPTRWEAVAYLNDVDDLIATAPGPANLLGAGLQPCYTSANPPAGWPLPPEVIDLLAQQGICLQHLAKVLNLGRVRNTGLEVSFSHPVSRAVSVYANYSYQSTPKLMNAPGDPLRPPAETISVSPRHRLNFGLFGSGEHFLGSLGFNYADSAYWAQVLQPQYYGYSPSYLMVNGSIGDRWLDGRLVTSLKGTNLLDWKIQQHVFGDVLRRTIVADVQLKF